MNCSTVFSPVDLRRCFRLPRFLAAMVFLLPPYYAEADFSVMGRMLLREGTTFQVRGVCYQPAPIGDNPSAAAPYGDYFTANYSALTARDLPKLRELGANVIRIYGWNPTADHTAFLDACFNGGNAPIFVLINRWIDPGSNWGNAATVAAIEQEFLQTDQGLGSHPAILGIVLGNEANIYNGNGDNIAFWQAMNQIATSIKVQTPTRLVSVAITDSIPQIAAFDAEVPAFDFWCVQTYRGTSMGSLFTEYAAASTKPLLITEFGTDAFNHATSSEYPDNAQFVATTVAGLWQEIAANASVCAGGCVFEYADEWWKSTAGSATTHDGGGFPLGSLPDGFANEEWWGLYRVSDNGADLDVLTPRATVAALQAAWAVETPSEPEVTLRVVTPPVSQTIEPGGTATFVVGVSGMATGGSLTYLWRREGNLVPGATGAQLVLTNLATNQSGNYSVRVSDGTSTVTSAAARLLVATPNPGRLKNLSVRSRSGMGADALVVGFVVADGSAQLLVRGVGPELATFFVGGVSPDPELQLFTGQAAGAFNEDWSSDASAIQLAAQSVGAFPLTTGSKDAAMLTMVEGARSVHLRDETPGVALAEVYEVGTNTGRLVNVSARTTVGTGDDVLVVGFVVDGNVPKRLLLRGVGPTLGGFGVSGVLENPLLRLYNAEREVVAENDDWIAGAVATVGQSVGAFPLEGGSKDAALVYTVVPGAFTAQVSGLGGTSGIALVEVYEVP